MQKTDVIKNSPNKRFGKPCIRNTRITIYDVLNWLNAGMSIDEIIDDFPELTNNDIKACLTYAAENNIKAVKE